MSAWTRYGKDEVTGGEYFVAWNPKYKGPAKRGILFCHGAGSLATMSLEYPAAAQTLRALAAEGHPILACDLGGKETWGNDTALARISAAKTYLQGTMGAASGKIHLFGISMGGQNSFVWAATNPTQVASITAMIPVCNLTDIVTNNRNGAAANANSAYAGGWSEATYGATHNPKTMAAAGKLTGIPIRLHYGLTDTICVRAESEAFIGLVGSNITSIAHPGGHDMDAMTAADRTNIVDFIKNNS